jgi:hypothetical protein
VSLKSLFILLVAFAAACGHESDGFAVGLEMHIEDDLAAPLGNVDVLVDGVQVATSDAAGAARATVHAGGPGRTSVAVKCPEGYRSPPPRSLPLGENQGSFRGVMRCRPEKRRMVVAVRAPLAEGTWVRADGKPLGQIQPDGTLHAELARPPDSDVRLTIDTSVKPDLLPASPGRDVHVADSDEIIVFDQVFTRKPKQVRRERPKEPPKPPRPYAIGPAR